MQTSYVTDTEGNKIAIQIPIAEWKFIEEDLEKLRRKVEVMQGIKEGVLEVRKARKEGRKLQSLDDFLSEF